MRRELGRAGIAVALCAALGACRQSAEARARDATVRAEREKATRGTPTVVRVTTPNDSGRVLYDAPPDLSAASPGRAGVAINGTDTATRTSAPAP